MATVKRMPHVALPEGSETRRFLDRQDPYAQETCHSRCSRKVACGSMSQIDSCIKSLIAVRARRWGGMYPKLYDRGHGGGRTSHWRKKKFDTMLWPRACTHPGSTGVRVPI